MAFFFFTTNSKQAHESNRITRPTARAFHYRNCSGFFYFPAKSTERTRPCKSTILWPIWPDSSLPPRRSRKNRHRRLAPTTVPAAVSLTPTDSCAMCVCEESSTIRRDSEKPLCLPPALRDAAASPYHHTHSSGTAAEGFAGGHGVEALAGGAGKEASARAENLANDLGH